MGTNYVDKRIEEALDFHKSIDHTDGVEDSTYLDRLIGDVSTLVVRSKVDLLRRGL
jgi:hypothetical protein